MRSLMATMAIRAVLGGRMGKARCQRICDAIMARPAQRFLVGHEQRRLVRGMGAMALEALPLRNGKMHRTFPGRGREIVAIKTNGRRVPCCRYCGRSSSGFMT